MKLPEPLHAFVTGLAGSATLEDAWSLFTAALAPLGFDVTVYGWGQARAGGLYSEECLHRLPEAYVALAEESGTDCALMMAAARSPLPVPFSRLPALSEMAPGDRELVLAAPAHGVHGGVLIPLHGPRGDLAYLTLHTSAGARAFDEALRESHQCAHLMTLYFHSHAQGLISVRPEIDASPPAAPLTPRELEVLEWTAAGKTAWEIAKILGLSERTVNFHVQNAMRKLDATSKTEAAARAVACGLVRLQPATCQL